MESANEPSKTPGPAAYHDAYAADYDRQVKEYSCYIEDVLFGLCYEYVRPGQSLLDLGIGSGLSALSFARAGLKVYGMDFSQAMLDLCRLKGIAADLKLHDLSQTPYPYASGQFDHLVCCGVLHFLPDLEPVFSEASRVLRAGGVFAFTTKTPLQNGGSPRKYDQTLVYGIHVYTHTNEYIHSLLEPNSLQPLKVVKSFVGEDAFYAWVARKTPG